MGGSDNGSEATLPQLRCGCYSAPPLRSVIVDVGIVPVKSLSRAKRRLAEHFAPDALMEIAWAMFQDTLALCRACDFLDWTFVSADAPVREAAEKAGLRALEERPAPRGEQGLNHALRFGIEAVTARGATSVTVIPVDVPLASVEDVRDLLDTGELSDAVVVPAHRDGGTNGLYLAPPGVLPMKFGDASLSAYVAAAEENGLRCSVLALEGLGFDIDTIEDVDALLANPASAATVTAEVLARSRPPASRGEAR